MPKKSKLVTDNTNEVMTRLAGTIRMLREGEHMTIRDFADKVGVGHSDIFRLEIGRTKNPSIFLMNKIAQAFGLTVDELMNFKAKPCSTCNGTGWVKDERK